MYKWQNENELILVFYICPQFRKKTLRKANGSFKIFLMSHITAAHLEHMFKELELGGWEYDFYSLGRRVLWSHTPRLQGTGQKLRFLRHLVDTLNSHLHILLLHLLQSQRIIRYILNKLEKLKSTDLKDELQFNTA